MLPLALAPASPSGLSHEHICPLPARVGGGLALGLSFRVACEPLMNSLSSCGILF